MECHDNLQEVKTIAAQERFQVVGKRVAVEVFVDRSPCLTELGKQPHIGHDRAFGTEFFLVPGLCVDAASFRGDGEFRIEDAVLLVLGSDFNLSCTCSWARLTTIESASVRRVPSNDWTGSRSSVICLPYFGLNSVIMILLLDEPLH